MALRRWLCASDAFGKNDEVVVRPQSVCVQESINGAWFEHFDLGHFGVARELFRLFCQASMSRMGVQWVTVTFVTFVRSQKNHDRLCAPHAASRSGQVGHKNQKLVQISKAALVREQFDGRHNKFVDGIKQELLRIQQNAHTH